jgi:hypothetical protein
MGALLVYLPVWMMQGRGSAFEACDSADRLPGMDKQGQQQQL